MELKELNKMTIEEIDDILDNYGEYYAEERESIISQRNYLLGLTEPIPKRIKCPKCDGITEIVEASCTFCGHKFCADDYVEYESDDYSDNVDFLDDDYYDADSEEDNLEKKLFNSDFAHRVFRTIFFLILVGTVIFWIWFIHMLKSSV